jgi:AbiU2
MNRSLFWRVALQGTIVSTFITMGRIFDDGTKHNIGRIRKVVDRTPGIFSIECLKQRKRRLPGLDVDEYVEGKHALEPLRAQAMLAEIDRWQGVYSTRYKGIRHSLAHKKFGTIEQVNALLAKTDIEEMKAMCAFLHALWHALDQLYQDGQDPVLRPRAFVLAPEPLPQGYMPGEEAYRDAQAAVLGVVTL